MSVENVSVIQAGQRHARISAYVHAKLLTQVGQKLEENQYIPVRSLTESAVRASCSRCGSEHSRARERKFEDRTGCS